MEITLILYSFFFVVTALRKNDQESVTVYTKHRPLSKNCIFRIFGAEFGGCAQGWRRKRGGGEEEEEEEFFNHYKNDLERHAHGGMERASARKMVRLRSPPPFLFVCGARRKRRTASPWYSPQDHPPRKEGEKVQTEYGFAGLGAYFYIYCLLELKMVLGGAYFCINSTRGGVDCLLFVLIRLPK